MRPDAPAVMRTDAFLQPKWAAIKPISSALALPSTGGDLSDAVQVPSAAWAKAETLAFGFTFTCSFTAREDQNDSSRFSMPVAYIVNTSFSIFE